MTISIIIPTRNSQSTLARCLDSVICQSYRDFDICLVDNVSADGTIGMIKDYGRRCPSLVYVSEPDRSCYDAMNKGIDLARGEWLYFLGSDDELYDARVFEDVFAGPFPESIGLVYGNVLVAGNTSWAKDGAIYDGRFRLAKLLRKNICHQAIFYRKALFAKTGKYNLNYSCSADWDMNLRFFACTQTKYIQRTIAKFHASDNSLYSLDSFGDDLSVLARRYFGAKIIPWCFCWNVARKFKRLLLAARTPKRMP